MATTTGVRLTKAGEALLAKLHAGIVDKLELTSFVIGDAVWTESEIDDQTHTALKNERVRASIDNIIPGGSDVGHFVCTGVINNLNVSEAFYVREIGMMAKDPDLGEILYLIDPIAGDAPTTMIEGNAARQDVPIRMELIAVSRDKVELILSESVAYVTPAQLDDAINSVKNNIATTVEAQTGANNTKFITPQRVNDAMSQFGLFGKNRDIDKIVPKINSYDDIKTSGVYLANSIANKLTKSPFPNETFHLEVYNDQSSSIVKQNAISFITGETKTRRYNTAWTNWVMGSYKLTDHLSIYVSTSGSDSNDGSINAPFATAEGVSNYINSINLGGFSVFVNVDGVFRGESGRFVFNKPCNGTICLQSKDINALSSITSIYISGGVNAIVRNIIFDIADTGNALTGLMVADYLSNLSVDGVIKIIDKTSVQQNVRPIFLSSKNSVIVVRTNIEVNTSSRVTFFNHVVRAESNATLSFYLGSKFNGDAQHLGARYYVFTNSVINTSGAGENFIPGTGVGIAQTGGIYV